jgi:hypothetical protein
VFGGGNRTDKSDVRTKAASLPVLELMVQIINRCQFLASAAAAGSFAVDLRQL